MSKEEKKVPELRFKGFHDDWEQRTLNQELSLLKDGTHGTHKNVANGLYLLSAKNIKNGEIIITEQDRQISREEFNKIHRNFVLHSGDVLLTVVGSIGETAILTKPKDVTFQRSVAYLRPSQMKSQFLYNLIQTVGFQNELKKKQVVSAQPGVYLGDLKKISIKMTKNATEQIKISQFTQLIDKIITLHQRKINILKQQKQSFINVMIPVKSENTPRIRFYGFDRNWDSYLLKDILMERRALTYESVEFPLMSFVQGKGVTPKNDRYDRSFLVKSNKKKYKKTKLGDFIYSSNNLETGSIGVNTRGNAVISPVYSIFYSRNIIESKFIGLMSYNEKFINEMIRYRQGVVYGQWRIHEKDFLKIRILIPSIEEQTMILNFLENLDCQILLKQKKLDELDNLKKAYLNKMFI